MYVITQAVEAVQVVAAAGGSGFDPGGMEAPPGAEQIYMMIRWLTWAVFGCCVAGVLLASGKMAIAHTSGRGGNEGMVNLAWVAMACVAAGTATGIVGLLMR